MGKHADAPWIYLGINLMWYWLQNFRHKFCRTISHHCISSKCRPPWSRWLIVSNISPLGLRVQVYGDKVMAGAPRDHITGNVKACPCLLFAASNRTANAALLETGFSDVYCITVSCQLMTGNDNIKFLYIHAHSRSFFVGYFSGVEGQMMAYREIQFCIDCDSDHSIRYHIGQCLCSKESD